MLCAQSTNCSAVFTLLHLWAFITLPSTQYSGLWTPLLFSDGPHKSETLWGPQASHWLRPQSESKRKNPRKQEQKPPHSPVMSEITLIHTSYRGWREWAPPKQFSKALRLHKKNDWGRGMGEKWGTLSCTHLPWTTWRIGSSTGNKCWEWVDWLCVKWKSRLMVSWLGNHSWNRMDTGSKEGSHYKYHVLISEQTSSTKKCMCQLSRQHNFIPECVPLPLKWGFSQPPVAMGNSCYSQLTWLSQSGNSSCLGEAASHCTPERLGRDSAPRRGPISWRDSTYLPPLQLPFWPVPSSAEVGRPRGDGPPFSSSLPQCVFL